MSISFDCIDLVVIELVGVIATVYLKQMFGFTNRFVAILTGILIKSSSHSMY